MPKERLDKVLASQNIGSRKESGALIRRGVVTVNGQVVRQADSKVDPEQDVITVGGQALHFQRYSYIMMNKPAGVLSAARDARQETVLDLLPPELKRRGLFPAGRLDRDTEGLLLITDDGDFAHRMLAPKSHVYKLYEAELDLPATQEDVKAFAAGIELSDRICLPAELRLLDATRVQVQICEGKDVSINMISKSGTTTEPAIAFRVFRELLEKKYGKEGARERIFCTTDKAKGTLKHLADEEGYETFVVPDDVGGRYSVLTAVGLLPIAVAGADIDALMGGAQKAMELYNNPSLEENDCYKYAAIRNILYNKGKCTEVMVSYEPCYAMMNEWWKQLFGESEGKDNKGLFPASVIFSTDLHSLGQYIQDGRRTLFETVVLIDEPKHQITLGNDPADVDGLNYLEGRTMAFINEKAYEGTVLAHNDGGVPNVVLHVSDFSEDTLGQLIYFFEKACAISGYILGVNPFNQPGVESYKKNMFALLGKPGYEDAKAELEKRLSR